MALIPSLKKEEAVESVKKIYNNFEETSGSVPEWVQVMAHSPQILEGFTHLFKSVMKEGKVESLLKWKIGYTVSEMLKCPFCVDVTEKMLKKLGIDEDGLENIKNRNYSSAGGEEEKELLKMVEDITDNGNINDRNLFDSFISKFDYEEAVEIVSVISLFNYINRFNNTFGVLPE